MAGHSGCEKIKNGQSLLRSAVLVCELSAEKLYQKLHAADAQHSPDCRFETVSQRDREEIYNRPSALHHGPGRCARKTFYSRDVI